MKRIALLSFCVFLSFSAFVFAEGGAETKPVNYNHDSSIAIGE